MQPHARDDVKMLRVDYVSRVVDVVTKRLGYSSLKEEQMLEL